MILVIYSTENNFIKSLRISQLNESLKIEKENNYYLYKVNISYPFDYNYYSIYIKFNLNSKDFINIKFKIDHITQEKQENDYTAVYIIIALICSIVVFGVIPRLYCIWKKIKQKKREKKCIKLNF